MKGYVLIVDDEFGLADVTSTLLVELGYDVVVHAIGLGFAMSMVLAHAPIILPAVLIRPLPYRPVLYLATAALQVSLLLRVAGDVRGAGWAWQAGGAGNVVALLIFVAMAAVLVIRR